MNIKRHKEGLNCFLTCPVKDSQYKSISRKNAGKWKERNRVCHILSSKTQKLKR